MSRPTVSQARTWRPEALDELADAWDAAAGRLQSCTGAGDPSDDWTGSAGSAARRELTAVIAAARAAARGLIAAAVAARTGAGRIATARRAVLDAVDAATAAGCRVADDGSVTPAPAADELLTRLCADDPVAVHAMLNTQAGQFADRIAAVLDGLSAADTETADGIEAAFDRDAPAAGTRPASALPSGSDIVASWPSTSQDGIAEQIAALTPEQRRQLIAAQPLAVGNTDGVPWGMRVAANRINIADAILTHRRTVDMTGDDKIRAVVATRFGRRFDAADRERIRAAIAANPQRRADTIAEHDRNANRHIEFYQGLLAQVDDPTGRDGRVDRQILAFDPGRSSLVELTGDLSRAGNVGVLVPGLNTTVLDSAANAETVRRFVAAGRGDVAMISYLGGPFPTGGLLTGVPHAADPRYALDMAPRLVAFSEDVNRTVDATGRSVAVTYIGHSYGGSILGTAERHGLTADRTIYVEAAGAGVGVYQPDDWHNRNPAVRRYAMTAPGDPIELVQGLPLGTHGADPDQMPGVTRLDTGRRLDGTVMGGLDAHSDVLNEPSDAWHRILEVITGRR